jgi:hypothetical protein
MTRLGLKQVAPAVAQETVVNVVPLAHWQARVGVTVSVAMLVRFGASLDAAVRIAALLVEVEALWAP